MIGLTIATLFVIGAATATGALARSHNGVALPTTSDEDRPQYLLFTRPPGLNWSQSNPSSLTPEFLLAPITGLNLTAETAISADKSLRIGNELIFSILQERDLTVLERSVRAALDAASEANVPVSLVFDSQNWWDEVSGTQRQRYE